MLEIDLSQENVTALRNIFGVRAQKIVELLGVRLIQLVVVVLEKARAEALPR